MTLIFLAIGVLSFIGAGAIIQWTRRGDEHVTMAVVFMVLTLGFVGLLMLGLALDSL